MEMPTLLEGFTRASGYPKGAYADGVFSAVDRWYTDGDFSASFIESNVQQLSYLSLQVVEVQWFYNENQGITYLEIKYGQPNQSGTSSLQSGRAEWYLDDGGQEIPIDKRKNDGSLLFEGYRTNHNHVLLGGAGVEVPSWWETATDTVSPDPNYRWVRDVGSASTGEAIVADKTRNIESVLSPAPIVVSIVKFTTYSAASAKAVQVGKRATPAKTFGFVGQWLVVGCSISKDGRRWAVTTRFQHAEQWDSSYYA